MTLIYNKANEEIPPFGLAQIDDGAEEHHGRIALNVRKPAGELRPSFYLINGPVPVRPQRLGVARFAVEPVWCLFDADGDDPAFDNDWGPVSDSWKLGKTGTGFRIVGKRPTEERVIVQLQLGPQLFMAQVDEPADVNAPSTATFHRLSGAKGNETEITEDTVEAYDRFGDVDDDSKAIIGYIDGDWEQVVGECAE